MTGYDLAKEFDSGVAFFWHAKHSQIYPELAKLVKEGLVSYDVVVQGKKMKKKLYSITETGKKDLQAWLLLDEPLEPTPKDVFKLRVYFSENMEDSQLFQQMNTQLDKRKSKLTMLEQFLSHYNGQEISRLPHAERADYFVVLGAVLRERAYVEWLERCVAELSG